MVLSQLIAQIGPAYDPLFWLRRKGLGGGSGKEKVAQELERYFELEQIGLIPDEKHHW